MKDVPECYKVLGLEPGSSPERVRRAYIQLSRFYDAARHVDGDPERLSVAQEKKKDIDDAYTEIRRFLPELQGDDGRLETMMEETRDFKEMVRVRPAEVSKPLMAAVIGGALVFLFVWAYHIYSQTRVLPAAPAPISDPDAALAPAQ